MYSSQMAPTIHPVSKSKRADVIPQNAIDGTRHPALESMLMKDASQAHGLSVMRADLDASTSTSADMHEAQWRAGVNRQAQPDALSHQHVASRAAADKRQASAMTCEEKAAADRVNADRRNAAKRAKRGSGKQRSEAELPAPVVTLPAPVVTLPAPVAMAWQDGLLSSPPPAAAALAAQESPDCPHTPSPVRPPPRPPAQVDLMPWQDGLDHMGDDASYPFFQGEYVIWRREPDHGCVWVVERDAPDNEIEIDENDVDANYLVLPWRGLRHVLESDGPDEALRRGERSSTRAAPPPPSCKCCGKRISPWCAPGPCDDCVNKQEPPVGPLHGQGDREIEREIEEYDEHAWIPQFSRTTTDAEDDDWRAQQAAMPVWPDADPYEDLPEHAFCLDW